MNSRLKVALPVIALGAVLFAPPAPAQGRGGMRASTAGFRTRSSFGISGRNGRGRSLDRRFLNDPGFLLAPYYYSDDEGDYEPVAREFSPVREVVAPPALLPIAAPTPGEPLLMEIHDGQWVRVATGGEMQSNAGSIMPDSPQSRNSHPGIVDIPPAASPLPDLPPAVIVFHDGHREELQRYMIEGDALYIKADYWSADSSTKRIPLAELDIPASLKLNKERGTKFNLPSGPNEVVVRF